MEKALVKCRCKRERMCDVRWQLILARAATVEPRRDIWRGFSNERNRTAYACDGMGRPLKPSHCSVEAHQTAPAIFKPTLIFPRRSLLPRRTLAAPSRRSRSYARRGRSQVLCAFKRRSTPCDKGQAFRDFELKTGDGTAISRANGKLSCANRITAKKCLLTSDAVAQGIAGKL